MMARIGHERGTWALVRMAKDGLFKVKLALQMIPNIYITTHQVLTSQLLSLLLAHRIITHVNVRSRAPYFWRHLSDSRPGFEVPPAIMYNVLDVIVNRWFQIGMTDMGQLTLIGDELRDKIAALVDALLVQYIFGENTEVESNGMDSEEEENEKNAKPAKIEKKPHRVPYPADTEAKRKQYKSRLPLPRTVRERWKGKAKDSKNSRR
ncbi:hypothetical protein EV426DRAFT_716977 [Tirmania nivea]|nr:hypothetical protein EV426DRAFT_716977 [Tirmania nivea]